MLYVRVEDSNVNSGPLQQFLLLSAFKKLIQRLADLLLLPGSDRGQTQDGNPIRGHDRIFQAVALLLLLAHAVERPPVHLDGKEKALRHTRVHPEVERAIPEHESSLFLVQAARIRQRIPQEHLGLIAKARIPGFCEHISQALFRNIFCGRAPTISPLNLRIPIERLAVGVVEDVENGDYVGSS